MSDLSHHVTDVLPDLLHGRLEGAARAGVERHLASCVECRAEYDLLGRAKEALPVVGIDRSRLIASLPTAAMARRHGIVRIALRVAAAIVVLAGAVTYSRWSSSGPVERSTDVAANPARAPSDPVRVAESVNAVKTSTAKSASAELGPGETLHDLSASELRALLDEITALDGVTPQETEVVPPSVGKGER